MDRFTCSFAGQCEPNTYGEYASEEECRVDCQGIPNKDLRYSIYEFAPAEARYLAPTDQVEIVKRLTGVVLTVDEAADTLDMLGRQAWDELARDDRFLPYVRRNYQGKLTFDLILEGGVLQNFLSIITGENNIDDMERDMMRILALGEFPTEHLRNGDALNFIYIDADGAGRTVGIWNNGRLEFGDHYTIRFEDATYHRLPPDLQQVIAQTTAQRIGLLVTLPDGNRVRVMVIPGKGIRCRNPQTGAFISCPVEYLAFIRTVLGLGDDVEIR